jgi:hypothetical protein
MSCLKIERREPEIKKIFRMLADSDAQTAEFELELTGIPIC